MIFNSKDFLFFFLIVFSIFWLLPENFRGKYNLRKYFLLLVSYFFYGFTEPLLTILLASVTTISYFIAIKVDQVVDQGQRKLLLISGLSVLVLPLLYFKYFNFITDSTNHILKLEIPFYKIILPVGISFYTFQTAGYLIDVYKKEISACQNFSQFALFVSFFPQLVAGPIERAKNLLPQIGSKFEYKTENFKEGLRIALWGFFKKIVIADRLAIFVDAIYQDIDSYNGITLLVATVFFAFQIYCDFSAYSDIAIGIARIFDIKLMRNFNRPYFASSIVDFWRRWHISLSTWFKDYIYLNLGGSRVQLTTWSFNIMIVFIISGFWHGAKWTFVIWGLVHGLAMLICKFATPLYQALENKILKPLQISALSKYLLTFIFVNITWVFFRAETVKDSLNIIIKVVIDIFKQSAWQNFQTELVQAGTKMQNIQYAIILICILLICDFFVKDDYKPVFFSSENALIRRSAYYITLLMIIFFGYFGKSTFIYFQF